MGFNLGFKGLIIEDLTEHADSRENVSDLFSGGARLESRLRQKLPSGFILLFLSNGKGHPVPCQ